MKYYLAIFFFIIQHNVGFANQRACMHQIPGYNIVKDSVFPFTSGIDKACFFAFYTTNPEPRKGVRGEGNLGNSLWYAYYKEADPTKIYEFPKPEDTNDWKEVCTINAISFYAMHYKKQSDVTIIGSCDDNAINYNFPFVFYLKNGTYVLDEDLYHSLYGFIALTVADLRAYVRSPESEYIILKKRNDLYTRHFE